MKFLSSMGLAALTLAMAPLAMAPLANAASSLGTVQCYDARGIADAGFSTRISYEELGFEAQVGEMWFGGEHPRGTFRVSLQADADTIVFRAAGYHLVIQRELNEHDLHDAKLVAEGTNGPIRADMDCIVEDLSLAMNAVSIEMFGMGPAVDFDAYQQMLGVIAGRIHSADLMSFVIRGYGIEGGSSSCAALSPFASIELQDLIDELTAIEPNAGTSYQVVPQLNCQE